MRVVRIIDEKELLSEVFTLNNEWVRLYKSSIPPYEYIVEKRNTWSWNKLFHIQQENINTFLKGVNEKIYFSKEKEKYIDAEDYIVYSAENRFDIEDVFSMLEKKGIKKDFIEMMRSERIIQELQGLKKLRFKISQLKDKEEKVLKKIELFQIQDKNRADK